MHPKPMTDDPDYRGAEKLAGQVALITGGDSGIGQAVAIAFAKEGARVAVNFLDVETEDALATKAKVEEYGGEIALIPGDIQERETCDRIVRETLERFGQLDILVNNAAYQMAQESLTDISDEQLERTFNTNVLGAIRVTRAALFHMKDGSRIINTTSVTAYRGSSHLLDYSSTKGALVTFTRSLAAALVDKKIRVNAVAPGPVWTPFIPPAFPAEAMPKFGGQVPMQRAAQPCELAPAYVFLASTDSTHVAGQTIHVNGGTPVGG
ncbi:MAG: SDR family oxidoreductase [Sumerlaeia bacterium]